MVRVLHVVTKMDRAGLETMLMNYYRHIDKDKLQFDFLTHRSEKGDYDDEILSMGGRIYNTLPIRPRHFGKYLADLKRFFAEHPEYKIVHSHIDSLSTFPLRAAKNAGVPVRIAHSHSTNFDKDSKLPLRYFSKWLLPYMATHYWGCSKAAVRFMFGNKICAPSNYTLLNNAIDSKKFAYCENTRTAVRERLGLSNSFVVGHIGRFVYAKNHEFLVDIFREVHIKDKSAVLLLVGDGENKLIIQQKVERLGLGSAVKFLGVRSDIPALLQAMDVFLLPSRFEGLPVVLVEAQASSLRCFTSANVVTGDANITGLVKYIPLTATATVWATEILEQRDAPRGDTSAQILDSGYDIKDAAKWLSNFYLQCKSMHLGDKLEQ